MGNFFSFYTQVENCLRFIVHFPKKFWFWYQIEIVSKKVYTPIWPVLEITTLNWTEQRNIYSEWIIQTNRAFKWGVLCFWISCCSCVIGRNVLLKSTVIYVRQCTWPLVCTLFLEPVLEWLKHLLKLIVCSSMLCRVVLVPRRTISKIWVEIWSKHK